MRLQTGCKEECRARKAPCARDPGRRGARWSAKLRPPPRSQLRSLARSTEDTRPEPFGVRAPQRPHSPAARRQQQQATSKKAQMSLDSTMLPGPRASANQGPCLTCQARDLEPDGEKKRGPWLSASQSECMDWPRAQSGMDELVCLQGRSGNG